MDNIQKTILYVLGLAGALALIVPNAVPAPGSKGEEANTSASAKTEVSKSRDSEIENADDADDDDDGSSYADDAIPAFGEPIGLGGGNGDPTAGFDDERQEDTAEKDTEVNLERKAVSLSSDRGGSENPKALSDAGLKNGSGGNIEVSAEDLKNARPF